MEILGLHCTLESFGGLENILTAANTSYQLSCIESGLAYNGGDDPFHIISWLLRILCLSIIIHYFFPVIIEFFPLKTMTSILLY